MTFMDKATFITIRREILNLTRSKLGDWIDITERQVHNYETGKTPIPARTALAMEYLALLHGEPVDNTMTSSLRV